MCRCFDSALSESAFVQSIPLVASVPHNFTRFPHALDELKTQVKGTIPYSRLLNKVCEEKVGRIRKFMGTESVVRDLEVMSRAAWTKGDVDKGVNFWGFSELHQGMYVDESVGKEKRLIARCDAL